VRDVLGELLTVWHAGRTAGVATVVRTIKSAPRPPGATMIVDPDGTVAGSVSGGCVEAAVYELASKVVQSGRPELHRYGISDDDAFAVGLTCGGLIDIFAEPVSRNTFPQLQAIADDIAGHVRPPSPPSLRIQTPVGSGAGWSSGRARPKGRWDLHVPTVPSPTTPGVFSPRAAPPCSPTAPTASARKPAWRSSSPATHPDRGC
jgi:xanthine/CO dehydrogenase XdhC/CoxF family maturation factor